MTESGMSGCDLHTDKRPRLTLPPIRPLHAGAYPSPESRPGTQGSERSGTAPILGDAEYSHIASQGWHALDDLMDLAMTGMQLEDYVHEFVALCTSPYMPVLPAGFKLHLFLRGLVSPRRVSADFYLSRHPTAVWSDISRYLLDLERVETRLACIVAGGGKKKRPLTSPTSFVRNEAQQSYFYPYLQQPQHQFAVGVAGPGPTSALHRGSAEELRLPGVRDLPFALTGGLSSLRARDEHAEWRGKARVCS